MEHSLVFVHGLMDTADHILKEIQSGVFPFPEKGNFRILLPNAPVRYITKLDKTGPSWYDMNHLEFTDPARYNNEQTLESVEFIKHIIRDEANNIHNGHYSKIFLSGFS